MGGVTDFVGDALGFDFIGDLVGDVTGSNAAASAAGNAANVQAALAREGIQEQRRQFDAVRQLLNPYAQTGATALNQQANLTGTNGPSAQRFAIDALTNSPQFSALMKQGENAILQNASATGGLRGGNVQSALGQFRPQLLSQLINDQYSRLGGLTSLGQNAAAGVGNAGMATANNVGNLLAQQGAAQAGGILAQGNAQRQAFGDLLQIGGMAAMAFSDRRLKSRIVHIGTHSSGLPWYEYDIFGRREQGVMADEAQALRPEAVSTGPGGFLMVDYSKL